MEIIVVFLIFLLFYWNIFVILRQKYCNMEYIFSKLKVRVLEHLADGEQHKEAPAGLTDAQYSVALSELKACDMVKVNVDEVGEVISSQIKTKGRAALDMPQDILSLDYFLAYAKERNLSPNEKDMIETFKKINIIECTQKEGWPKFSELR